MKFIFNIEIFWHQPAQPRRGEIPIATRSVGIEWRMLSQPWRGCTFYWLIGERWLNGAESDEDIYVAGVAEFNQNAYVGGYYSSDVNFFNFVTTSTIPYASTPSNTDAFLARYGELANPTGPFYKNNPTTHANNIQLQEDLSFSIIPNPASNQATIQLKDKVNSPWAYSLYNLMGAEIVNRSNIAASKTSDIIQLNSLPPGVYVLVISHGESISSSKLIVQ